MAPPTRDQQPTIGLIAVGRPTFEVASAAPVVRRALAEARSIEPSLVGDDVVRTSPAEITEAVEAWPAGIRTLVVVFATFTDSTLPAAAALAADHGRRPRLVLWSLPEPQLEPRLVWNSLCGSILTNYRFHNESFDVRAIHRSPGDTATANQLVEALTPDPAAVQPGPTGAVAAESATAGAVAAEAATTDAETSTAEAERIVATLAEARIGIVGRPPDGFEPCELLVPATPIGTRFEQVELSEVFDLATHGPGDDGGGTPVTLRPEIADLVDIGARRPDAVRQSLRLHDALRRLADERHYDALAVRCWPECFTRWGGAACGPLSFLGDAGLPAACEADAYGALTCLLFETITGRAAFLADLVEIDRQANTCAVWHCGVAPRSMADPTRPILAIDHPNRGIPLAVQFGLAPGPVTLCRISQSGGRLRLAVGSGTALDRPPPFAGTSGTIRLETPVDDLLRRITDEGLEHHLVVAPGDHRAILAAVAQRWDIPLLAITP